MPKKRGRHQVESVKMQKSYCLVTEANVYERLAQGGARQCSGLDWTRDLQSPSPNTLTVNQYTTELHRGMGIYASPHYWQVFRLLVQFALIEW